MTEFIDEDFVGARFTRVDLRDARFLSSDFTGVEMRGVDLIDVTIEGEVENLTINGVEVSAFVNAELDRRYPERLKLRPTDPDGFREAWDLIEQLWSGTVERARGLDPALLHESVDGEWSFIETLRHLVFATDAWIRRAVLGDPSPWDPLDLPWDQMADTPGIPRDREVRPSLETVLELRRDRMGSVRDLVNGLTEEQLAARTTPVEGLGWPPPVAFPVRDCLLTILNEESAHRRYAERDLTILTNPR